MATADDNTESLIYAKEAADRLEQERVTTLLKASGATEHGATSHELFKLGYITGCYDTYEVLHRRVQRIATLFKSVYDKINDAVQKYDDTELLRDLSAIVGDMAGYLVEECEQIMAASRKKLSEQSKVPMEIVDDTLPINQVPAQMFIDIGKAIAQINHHQWSIFAVSDGYLGPDDGLLTIDELREAVITGKVRAKEPPDHRIPELYRQYGARQARQVRKMYKSLEDDCNRYRAQHAASADVLADNFIEKISRK